MINSIDEKDKQILELLKHNARMSYSDIGEKVSLSRTAVKNRISSLEERGIIAAYTAVIDPLASSEKMNFILNIETTPESFDRVKQSFVKAPEVVLLMQSTGKCHLSAICATQDIKSMREFINKMHKSSDGILYINANAVIDVIKGTIPR